MNVCILGSYAKALVMTTERIPTVGETVIGRNFRQTFGGKGSDMAVQAARLGAVVSFVGVVGADTFGQEFIDLMKAEQVDIKALRIASERSTGAGFILKDSQAQNMIVVDMGANELFQEQDIQRALPQLEAAQVVVAQLEIPLATALYGLKQAKALGKTTILNPAPAMDLRQCDLSDIDILTPNETEARVCLGLSPQAELTHREVADELLKTGCKVVAMTLGSEGVGLFTRDRSVRIDAYQIEVVDSNGAGDSFNAALAVSLAGGESLETAARFANAVAGLCCTRWETVPSYHTRAEVERFVQQQST